MSPLMSPQFGRTALVEAVAHGETTTATLLIERGADKEAKNNVRIDYNRQLFAVLKNKWCGRVVVSFSFDKLVFFMIRLLLPRYFLCNSFCDACKAFSMLI